MSENRKQRIRIRLTSKNPDDPVKILQALHQAFPHKKITLKANNHGSKYPPQPRRMAEEQLEARAISLIIKLDEERNHPLPIDENEPQQSIESPEEIAKRWNRIKEWSNRLMWPIITNALYDVLKKLIGLG